MLPSGRYLGAIWALSARHRLREWRYIISPCVLAAIVNMRVALNRASLAAPLWLVQDCPSQLTLRRVGQAPTTRTLMPSAGRTRPDSYMCAICREPAYAERRHRPARPRRDGIPGKAERHASNDVTPAVCKPANSRAAPRGSPSSASPLACACYGSPLRPCFQYWSGRRERNRVLNDPCPL